MKMASGLKILDRYSFSSKASRQKIEKILSLLSQKSLSRKEISEQIHVNYRHTKNYIDYLLNTKQIYISLWKFETQDKLTRNFPYYRAGNKKSKPKPSALTVSEKCKRYREKLKKDDDRREKSNFKRRARRRTIKPDWTSTWIKASNLTQINDAGA